MTQQLTDEERKAFLKKWRKRVLIVGALLGIACKTLPPDYQGPCEAIAQVCKGFLP